MRSSEIVPAAPAPSGASLARLAIAAGLTTVAALALWSAAPKGVLVVVALAALGVVVWASYRRPEIGIVAIVGAATLDLTGRIASIGPLKLTLYQGFVALAVVFAVWLVKTGRRRLSGTPIDLPLLLFLAVVAASVVIAIDPARAIVALVSLASSALLVYLIVVLVDSPEAMMRAVLGVLCIAVAFTVLTLLEKRGYFSIGTPIYTWGIGIRPKVTFKDPNMLGSFLMVASMLALPLLPVLKRWWMKGLLAVSVLFCAFGVYETGSRGALGALAVALVVAVLAVRIPLRQKVTIVVVAALAVALVVALAVNPAWLQQKVFGAAGDESAMARVYMARSAVRMAADHPFGVGAANYPLVYPWYRDAAVRFNLVESHTMPLTLLVEYGLLGLALFTWLLWRFVSRTWLVAHRESTGILQSVAAGALAAGIGVIAQSFTYSLETSKFLWLAIGVGMAVYTMWMRRLPKEDPL